MVYLAGQSSVHHARPEGCVSYAEVMVGCGPYIEQRLDTRGVLGGLAACQHSAETAIHCGSRTILEYLKLWWRCS